MVWSIYAEAHTASKAAGDFYAGVLHPLTALEHVLSFAALGILAGQKGSKAQSAVMLFALATMLGAVSARWIPALPYVGLTNILSAVVLGMLIAIAWRLPLLLVYGLAVLFGLTHGFANGAALGPEMKAYLFVPGLGLAALVVAAYGMIVTDYLLQRRVGWLQIAVRVAGSWIAAIGVLVLATSGRAILRA